MTKGVTTLRCPCCGKYFDVDSNYFNQLAAQKCGVPPLFCSAACERRGWQPKYVVQSINWRKDA